MKKKRSLRTHRGTLDTRHAVRVGREGHPLVYGYGFPSRPGMMKIGTTRRGLVRIMEQSTGFPEKPTVFFLLHDKNAALIEKRLHAALAHHQADTLGVEWFHVTMKQVMAQSPELRRGLSLQRWKSGWRWALAVSLVGLWVMAFPAFLWAGVFLFREGPSFGHGGDALKEYARLWAINPIVACQTAWQAWSWVWVPLDSRFMEKVCSALPLLAVGRWIARA